jgi:hypothetical protein
MEVNGRGNAVFMKKENYCYVKKNRLGDESGFLLLGY